jgi:hypothetical protein
MCPDLLPLVKQPNSQGLALGILRRGLDHVTVNVMVGGSTSAQHIAEAPCGRPFVSSRAMKNEMNAAWASVRE